MAEFCEVMKQAKRMCSQAAVCSACSLKNKCLTTEFPCKCDENYYAEIERVVMRWAEEHPETRYPSWYEWQKTTFPDSAHPICPKTFMSHKAAECDISKSCDMCMGQPIPADIAEKLGVKPIGGVTDENA